MSDSGCESNEIETSIVQRIPRVEPKRIKASDLFLICGKLQNTHFCAVQCLCRRVRHGRSMTISDCNPGIEVSTPGSGIEKFVILGSRDPVSGSGLQIGRHFNILN